MPGFDFPLIVAGGGVTMNVMPEEVFLRRQVELNPPVVERMDPVSMKTSMTRNF